MITYRDSVLPTDDEFWALFATTGWNDEYRLSAAELHNAIANSWYVISAFEAERLVGFGRVVSDTVLHAMIYDLIVHPYAQNRGIGREILRRLVERCRKEGIRDIQLFAAAGKRRFYERSGFRQRPEDSPGMEFVPRGASRAHLR